MALIMTDSGHVAIAKAMKDRTYYLGVGGLPSDYPSPWTAEDVPPPFDTASSDLLEPYGYKLAQRTIYVKEDDVNGSIVVDGKKYSESADPTAQLYVEFLLDIDEVADKTIYQLALFMDLQPIEGLPTGQTFFLPQDVADVGLLYIGENIKPLYKQAGIKELYGVVLNF